MTVQDYMSKSGIMVNLKGYETVKRALELCVEEPDIPICAVYEIVAYKYGIEPEAAEHRMRTAIKSGFPNMNEDLRHKIFANHEKVKVGEYLKSVSYAIRNNII